MLRLRDRLLPLVSLAEVLNLIVEPFNEEPDSPAVVVMQVGETRFGLIVDEVFDTEEIVVKPLAKRLGSMSEFSGATILGDGAVIMILDPNGIAKSVASWSVGAIACWRSRRPHRPRQERQASARSARACCCSGRRQLAARMSAVSLVTRLEDLDASPLRADRAGSGRAISRHG